MSRSDDVADPPEVPSRRLVLKGAVAAGAFGVAAAGSDVAQAATPGRAPVGRPARYANPLVRNRADPHIHRHSDGSYYFTATAPEYDRIILRRSRTLAGLGTADESVIWRKHPTGAMGAHIWAPEIHHIDGAWYIYFASAPAEDV